MQQPISNINPVNWMNVLVLMANIKCIAAEGCVKSVGGGRGEVKSYLPGIGFRPTDQRKAEQIRPIKRPIDYPARREG